MLEFRKIEEGEVLSSGQVVEVLDNASGELLEAFVTVVDDFGVMVQTDHRELLYAYYYEEDFDSCYSVNGVAI